MESKPTRYQAVDSCQEVKRRVFCRSYNGCLDHAIRMNWPGFSCESCSSFEHEKLDQRDLSEDYARCMALAFVSGAVEVQTAAH